MSIRKRLFLSNAAMVAAPIIVFIITAIFLGVVFRDEFREIGGNYHQGPHTEQKSEEPALFAALKKTASLTPEKLTDPNYLQTLPAQLKRQNATIIIRKGDTILYERGPFLAPSREQELPSFGNEGYTSTIHFSHGLFSLRQHDFYFKDGTQGSLFFITKPSDTSKFARTLFPLLFLGLIAILILTNILLSYFVSRSILKPVRQLSAAANKIKHGELDFKMTSASKDELGTLVKTFDGMRQSLKELMELRDQYENNRRELVANISHDLKTPLTSIRGYVEGIQDGVANTKEKQKRYLDTIQTKVKYMDHLIDELFLYSKLDVKGFPFHFEVVNLKAFMRDYLDEMELEYHDQNIQISLQTSEDFNARVVLDRDNIIRVLNNIISNSMKYSDKDQCVIDIELRDLEDRVEVRVKDNGPGVSEARAVRIFERFYRADPARNSSTGGSGLGLAIASKIIKGHGGHINAYNHPGEGLTIIFTLKKQTDSGDSHAPDINY